MKLVRNETIENIAGIPVRFEPLETGKTYFHPRATHRMRFAFEANGREYWGELCRVRGGRVELDLYTRNEKTRMGVRVAENAKAEWRAALAAEMTRRVAEVRAAVSVVTPAEERAAERAAAPAVWTPTADECRLIRDAAVRETGKANLKLEPGIRYNTESDRGRAMNIALISEDADWNDTDLADHSDWAAFRAGVPLSPDGRAIVDFYCYSTGRTGELESNVSVYYAGGRIGLIQGTMNPRLYADPRDVPPADPMRPEDSWPVETVTATPGVVKLSAAAGESGFEPDPAGAALPDMSEATEAGAVETIDLTPTWAGVLPVYMAALEAGTYKGRQAAETELRRMATLADERNALAARCRELETIAIEANESAHCVPGMAGEALRGALRAAGWDCPEPDAPAAEDAETAATVAVGTPITWRRICDLLCTGIEGGYSPWLHAFRRSSDWSGESPAYYVPEFWQGGGTYAAEFDSENDDEGEGTGRLTVNATALVNALHIMAESQPSHFADFVAENDDACTGDVFLQCLLIGSVIYG